ncbi:MAG: fused MFS/spermidine synthase [Acidobacteria bacterium]|nr:fused MFS/spermidine synthase [Acidobacteriota bacterium]
MGLLYALTLLLNALLLFLVQPMIAKTLLPYLGGTSAVWNTCVLFFQFMLLGGYGYSHVITKKLALKPQIALHLSLFVAAAFVLPFAISENALTTLSNGAQPIRWMLWQLLLLVGAPFLMLATSGPLLQHWFAQTDHPDAQDPYFLYGASNVGSLLALLGYPLLMEPTLRLRQQSLVWAISYSTLLLLLGACAVVRWQAGHRRQKNAAAESTQKNALDYVPLTWPQRARWVWLAFVPSSLMLGVTTHLSTNISPFPLLWVVPLALYLLTFVLAFAQQQRVAAKRLMQSVQISGICMAAVILAGHRIPLTLAVCLPLLFFFTAAWLCHRQLAESRPATTLLTEFYLWLSVGGMLGGVFNSLLAPFLFPGVWEFPLMVTAALLICPTTAPLPFRTFKERNLKFAWPAGLVLLTFCLGFSLPRVGVTPPLVLALSLGLPALLGIKFIRKIIPLSLTLAAIITVSGSGANSFVEQSLWQERNFFGVKRVVRDRTRQSYELGHGNTIHGRQYLDPQRQCEPLSYYHQNGPIGQLMSALQTKQIETPQTAIVGLGAGALACYAQAHQDWTYFEIDPGVIHVAHETGHFTYLKKCSRAPYHIVFGDARLQLRKAKEKQFGLIVLDAFSSDAVPTHLLTKEAMELYLAKLAVGGVIALHISNTYLDLRPVVAGLAQSANLECLINDDLAVQQSNAVEFQDPAIWVVLARRTEDFGTLSQHPHWHRLESAAPQLWTDDYSNLLRVFKRR